MYICRLKRENKTKKIENDMRKLFFLLLLAAATALGSQAVTVQNTAGQLSQLVTNTQITELTVTGTMDASDFLFITNELTELTSINLSQVNIVAMENGHMLYGTTSTYQANEVPRTAFFGKKLTTVVLPANIESVGFAAFAGCYQLRSVTFPASLTNIGDYAFAGSALTSVNIPATVEVIGKGAFARCESLTSATIDGTFIDDFTFLGDFQLSQVTLGPTVRNISKGMFNGCTALKTITVDPACSITRIDDEAFINSGLEAIDLSTLGVATVGEWALAQTKLTNVELADGMTQLGEGALAHNNLLENVILPGMGHDYPSNGPRQAPHRPHTIATINDYTFAGDSKLNAGNLLRNGVTTIGNYALYNVSADIDTMWLPSSVNYLGDMAMAGMIGMKTFVTDATEVPALGNDVWAGVDQPSVPLITPDNQTAELYKAADQWMNFFFETHVDIIIGDVNGDGNVNISDVTALINYLLSGDEGSVNLNNADVNQDGNINISDVTALINLLLSGNASKSVSGIHDVIVNQTVPTSDKFILPTVMLKSGETRSIDVELENTEHNYTAMSCELILPQGVELISIKGLDRGASHSFYTMRNEVEDNVYSIMGADINMMTMAGNEGKVMRLTIKANDDFDAMKAEVKLVNVVLATNHQESFLANDATAKINNNTGIEQILSDKEIDHVRYINVAGQESDMPFDGVNIMVTTYTDGTTTTVKVIK